MQLHSFSIDGLAALPQFEWRMDSQPTRFSGPQPKISAIRDALELGFAVFSKEKLVRVLRRWAWGPEEIIEEGGRVVEAHWRHSDLAKSFVLDRPNPKLQLSLYFDLDATVLADLRRWTVRQPELQFALLEAPTLRLTISLEFGQQRQFMRVLVGGIYLGSERIELTTEPYWLPQLWTHLDAAFASHDGEKDTAAQAAQAAYSVHEHARYVRFTEALPDLSPIRLVQLGEQWQFWVAEQPLRAFGAQGLRQVQHAALLYLSGASMVWLEGACACLENSEVQIWGPEEGADALIFESERKGLVSFSSS